MALERMALTNYRGFASRQSVELRPITVVLGRNNAGKSALVRAPVMLAAGIHTQSREPLDIDDINEDLLDSFVDLIHGSPADEARITVEVAVRTQEGLFRLVATILDLTPLHRQVVESLELFRDGTAAGRLVRVSNDPDPARFPLYDVDIGGQARRTAVDFRGLLPARLIDVPPAEASLMTEVGRRIRDDFPTVRYLGPFRDRPHRRYRLPGRMRTEVGATGEYAAGILASDLARD